ncbi:hypothetical protein AVEN_171428-1 [Araneus ventricosus]|uniref:Uncharacterized protein n=1 Tax=Araneus ventricosus TaxID=182803 RepID=A0A4Y2D2M5_ARAVE|nr:hypothetical protein AVEN_171428-1 [Araneus ventricosus]
MDGKAKVIMFAEDIAILIAEPVAYRFTRFNVHQHVDNWAGNLCTSLAHTEDLNVRALRISKLFKRVFGQTDSNSQLFNSSGGSSITVPWPVEFQLLETYICYVCKLENGLGWQQKDDILILLLLVDTLDSETSALMRAVSINGRVEAKDQLPEHRPLFVPSITSQVPGRPEVTSKAG